jgi:hypothetical protein
LTALEIMITSIYSSDQDPDVDFSHGHECIGVTCPYVVDTGESLVCSVTGVCVGDVFADSFDNAQLRSTVHLTVKESGLKKKACPSSPRNKPDSDIYGDCFRVVRRILKSNAQTVHTAQAKDVSRKRTTKIVVKENKKRTVRLPDACKEEVRECDDVFEQTIAQRCADSCAFSLATLPSEVGAKTNIEYICLATLYMMREGVVVKGIVLCEKEESIACRLPSLNSLTAFGFKKSKYTKAERFLRRAIEEAIFTRPLHKIKI